MFYFDWRSTVNTWLTIPHYTPQMLNSRKKENCHIYFWKFLEFHYIQRVWVEMVQLSVFLQVQPLVLCVCALFTTMTSPASQGDMVCAKVSPR